MTLKKNDRGFTLVEVLIAMVVSAVVLSGIYSTYQSQQRSYILQDQIAQMQQNLRAAMYLMTRELRMAGFDPSGSADAGIVDGEWTNTSLRFTKDDNGDGDLADSGENLTYSLYTSASGVRRLGRKNPTTNQPVAENIQEIWFVYLDGNNNVTATLSDVRSVEITLVARTARPTVNYVNTMTYSNKRGTKTFGPYNDAFYRSVLSEQVNCRNLGLGS